MKIPAVLLIVAALPLCALADDRDALQPFNHLIGAWRGTGTPNGTREEKQKGFWQETQDWQWQFQGKSAWLKVDFKDGKHFRSGTLRFRPAKKDFEMTLVSPTKEELRFEGQLTDKTLSVEREGQTETQRLVFTFLHANRFLYRYEVRPAGKTLFTKVYDVGTTKEGESFAVGSGKPECIVSGGLGTTAVVFEGKTYYVCCGGCKTEFQENPIKYVREFEKKGKK